MLAIASAVAGMLINSTPIDSCGANLLLSGGTRSGKSTIIDYIKSVFTTSTYTLRKDFVSGDVQKTADEMVFFLMDELKVEESISADFKIVLGYYEMGCTLDIKHQAEFLNFPAGSIKTISASNLTVPDMIRAVFEKARKQVHNGQVTPQQFANVMATDFLPIARKQIFVEFMAKFN